MSVLYHVPSSLLIDSETQQLKVSQPKSGVDHLLIMALNVYNINPVLQMGNLGNSGINPVQLMEFLPNAGGEHWTFTQEGIWFESNGLQVYVSLIQKRFWASEFRAVLFAMNGTELQEVRFWDIHLPPSSASQLSLKVVQPGTSCSVTQSTLSSGSPCPTTRTLLSFSTPEMVSAFEYLPSSPASRGISQEVCSYLRSICATVLYHTCICTQLYSFGLPPPFSSVLRYIGRALISLHPGCWFPAVQA
jgi:hypothetical protein